MMPRIGVAFGDGKWEKCVFFLLLIMRMYQIGKVLWTGNWNQ
jgi:hypothetical protein